jgi:GNAT superfamily N-acetyltransferase
MSQLKLVDFVPHENKKELKRFVELAWTLNKNDPCWVAPLRVQVLDNLDTRKNPFYKHAEIRCWNAYKDGEHVGRIAAITDKNHNEIHKDKTGFFGFFEAVNDPAVAKELFQVAEEWVKSRGMDQIRGPVNPSLNHEAGLLIDGFDREPYIMMTHNLKYYQSLIEGLGYGKSKDLLAFEMPTSQPFPERMLAMANKVLEKAHIKFRPIDMKNFKSEVKLLKDIYNDAWEQNWGFVPMNDAEFDHMAKSLKDAIWPEFCLIAESQGQPIGFSLALPDINQVLKNNPSGRLLPFGLFKLLLGLNPKKKKITQVRVITLGVKKAFRATGVASTFYLESYRRAKEFGLVRGEMSWILEDNQQMLAAINAFWGKPAYKTYRIYDKALLS